MSRSHHESRAQSKLSIAKRLFKREKEGYIKEDDNGIDDLKVKSLEIMIATNKNITAMHIALLNSLVVLHGPLDSY